MCQPSVSQPEDLGLRLHMTLRNQCRGQGRLRSPHGSLCPTLAGYCSHAEFYIDLSHTRVPDLCSVSGGLSAVPKPHSLETLNRRGRARGRALERPRHHTAGASSGLTSCWAARHHVAEVREGKNIYSSEALQDHSAQRWRGAAGGRSGRYFCPLFFCHGHIPGDVLSVAQLSSIGLSDPAAEDGWHHQVRVGYEATTLHDTFSCTMLAFNSLGYVLAGQGLMSPRPI